ALARLCAHRVRPRPQAHQREPPARAEELVLGPAPLARRARRHLHPLWRSPAGDPHAPADLPGLGDRHHRRLSDRHVLDAPLPRPRPPPPPGPPPPAPPPALPRRRPARSRRSPRSRRSSPPSPLRPPRARRAPPPPYRAATP